MWVVECARCTNSTTVLRCAMLCCAVPCCAMLCPTGASDAHLHSVGLLVVDCTVPGSPADGVLEPGDVLVRVQGEVSRVFCVSCVCGGGWDSLYLCACVRSLLTHVLTAPSVTLPACVTSRVTAGGVTLPAAGGDAGCLSVTDH
jgi:hypothetical protein